MKIVLLEYIPDCLGGDRTGDDVVDIFGGLDSIIKLFKSDLADDCLLVPI